MMNQHGFTLVELVVVLVLISLLSVIAIPRFLDWGTSAKQTATNAIASSLGTVSAANFAKRSANSLLGSRVSNCTDLGALLTGGLPSGYTIRAQAIASESNVSCELKGLGGSTATFLGIGIG
jgi:MSHA pilin protein MshA